MLYSSRIANADEILVSFLSHLIYAILFRLNVYIMECIQAGNIILAYVDAHGYICTSHKEQYFFNER